MKPPIDPLLYVTSIEEVLWGGGLVALTMGIHALGMLAILRFDNRLKARFESKPSFFVGLSNLVLASWLMVFVHLLEVFMWATFFLWMDCFPNRSMANYFSLNEYTTLGSELHLPLNWRLLEGLIAIAGMLAFAWSTGVLLTLARDFQAQQLQRFAERRKPRTTPER